MSNDKFESVGVVIGRFQVPTPTAGHDHLFDTVLVKHDTVVALLGTSPARNKHNALDYQLRAGMISERYGVLTIPLLDKPADREWSDQIDRLLRTLFPNKAIILYGGRDSFIKNYIGKLSVVEIEEQVGPTGSDVRRAIRFNPQNTHDFRAGVIYATECDFPRAVPCVDIAIVRKGEDSRADTFTDVLMARKPSEEAPTGWRFIGGFVDPTDQTLEIAARREALEETGCEVGVLHYAGSSKIPDWRYRKSTEGIISSFFVAEYLFGTAKPHDDISETKWVPLDRLNEFVLPVHLPLAVLLQRFLKRDDVKEQMARAREIFRLTHEK